MSDAFRIRLRVRVGKGLTTDETSYSVRVAGREVTIKSEQKGEPLKAAKWIVLLAGGFLTEAEAEAFGNRLKSIFELAALCSRLGTDVGEDVPTTWMNEAFARSQGWIAADERLAPNIHGLAIIPDDDKTKFPCINAQGALTTDPGSVLDAISELGNQEPFKLSDAAPGIRVLNMALMTNEPLAQVVLAFSAVEALGQDEEWSPAQSKMLAELAQNIEVDAGGDVEKLEIATALRRSHRLGLRQGVMRVLDRLNLSHLKREWDRLYGLRSGVVHGTKVLPDAELNKLAQDTVKLCGKVILALATRDGATLPAITTAHFQ